MVWSIGPLALWGAKEGKNWLGKIVSGTAPDNLIHLHSLCTSLRQKDCAELDKALKFIRALRFDSAHFAISGWDRKERRALDHLINALKPSLTGRVSIDDIAESAQETAEVIKTKIQNCTGLIPKMKESSGFVNFEALKGPFEKIFRLLEKVQGEHGHFLMPFARQAFYYLVDKFEEHGPDYLEEDDAKKDLKAACQAFKKDILEGKKPLSEIFNKFCTHRTVIIFGVRAPFTYPAFEAVHQEPIEELTLDELKAFKQKSKSDFFKRIPFFLWHYILVQWFCGKETTSSIAATKEAMEADDPIAKFGKILERDLEDDQIGGFSKTLCQFLWFYTPFFRLSQWAIEKSFEKLEKKGENFVATMQARVHSIEAARDLEAVLKKWIHANKQVQEITAWEDELGEILTLDENRTIKINLLTNVLVDLLFPSINLVDWHRSVDENIQASASDGFWLFKPIRWCLATVGRILLYGVKFGLLGVQKATNVLGRFFTKMLLKRLNVMHHLFDFRSRIQAGDHHRIEAKLKSFLLLALQELNKMSFVQDEPDDDEIERFQDVNHNLMHLAETFMDLLDLHEGRQLSIESVVNALVGDEIRDMLRDYGLRTAITQGVILINELYHNYIEDEKNYIKILGNIYGSLAGATIDTSETPKDVDEEIRGTFRDFKHKVIKELVQRAMGRLGKKEVRRSKLYVKKLKDQLPIYQEWERQFTALNTALGTENTTFQTTELQQSVVNSLSKIKAIYDENLNALRDVFPKMKQIYYRFHDQQSQILEQIVPLQKDLDDIQKAAKLRDIMKELEVSWKNLKRCQLVNKNALDSFINNSGKITPINTNELSAKAAYDSFQKQQLKDYITKNSAKNEIEEVRTKIIKDEAIQLLNDNADDGSIYKNYTQQLCHNFEELEANIHGKKKQLITSLRDLYTSLSPKLIQLLEEDNLLHDFLMVNENPNEPDHTSLRRVHIKGTDSKQYQPTIVKLKKYRDNFLQEDDKDAFELNYSQWTTNRAACDNLENYFRKRRKALLEQLKAYPIAARALHVDTIDQIFADAKKISQALDQELRQNAKEKITATKTNIDELKRTACDPDSQIPYFVFGLPSNRDKDNPDQEGDFSAIDWIVLFAGETTERIINKGIALSKNPLLIPWAGRELFLEYVWHQHLQNSV